MVCVPNHRTQLTVLLAGAVLEVIKFKYPEHGVIVGPCDVGNEQVRVSREGFHQC